MRRNQSHQWSHLSSGGVGYGNVEVWGARCLLGGRESDDVDNDSLGVPGLGALFGPSRLRTKKGAVSRRRQLALRKCISRPVRGRTSSFKTHPLAARGGRRAAMRSTNRTRRPT